MDERVAIDRQRNAGNERLIGRQNSAAFATSQGVPILWRSGTRASRAGRNLCSALAGAGARMDRHWGVNESRQDDIGAHPEFSILDGNLLSDLILQTHANLGGNSAIAPQLTLRARSKTAKRWGSGLTVCSNRSLGSGRLVNYNLHARRVKPVHAQRAFRSSATNSVPFSAANSVPYDPFQRENTSRNHRPCSRPSAVRMLGLVHVR